MSYPREKCFLGSSEPVFLFFSGYNHNVMDGRTEGFYLCSNTQGKDRRRNIKDNVLTWKKSSFRFLYQLK